ncbi:MAG: DUF4956 domain-containing protein [Clostridia bacterium]|nr:DUF4956 domain-containing protein [Clostridia bacterium]
MSFTDIIKKSVLEGFNAGDLSTTDIITSLGISLLVGLFIYIIYRLSTKGGFYNRSFNKALATLPVITAAIMLAMQSNLVISLGMVGALSIVRFRNAVKDSADLTFLFWSISAGIISGAGLFKLCLILCLAVTALVFLLDLIPTFRAPCVLVISASSDSKEKDIIECIKKFSHSMRIRSRSATSKGYDWVIEIRVRKGAELVSALSDIKYVKSVNLLSHDGEVRF